MHFSLKLFMLLCAAIGWGMTPVWATPEGARQEAAQSDPAPSREAQDRAYFSDLPLLDQDGKPVRFYTDVLKDRVVLINFIFTNCEDACPLLTQMLVQVKDLLGDQMGDPIYFVSISIDPERDTPAALKDFAQRTHSEHAAWTLLTGDRANIDPIVKRLGQYSPEVEAHSTLLLAGNVNTRHWMKIPPTATPPIIAEKLRILAKAKD